MTLRPPDPRPLLLWVKAIVQMLSAPPQPLRDDDMNDAAFGETVQSAPLSPVTGSQLQIGFKGDDWWQPSTPSVAQQPTEVGGSPEAAKPPEKVVWEQESDLSAV